MERREIEINTPKQDSYDSQELVELVQNREITHLYEEIESIKIVLRGLQDEVWYRMDKKERKRRPESISKPISSAEILLIILLTLFLIAVFVFLTMLSL